MILSLLVGWTAFSPLSAEPTVQEKANYDAACAAVVDAVNAYRASNSMTALGPLIELCRAAREDAEFRHLGVGPNKSIFVRAGDAGYAGTFLSPIGAFDSKGQVSAVVLFERLLTNPDNVTAFLSPDADYIGVGLALKAEGASSEYRLRIVLGKEIVGGLPDGNPGLESSTARGLLDISLLPEMLAGVWSGDSINGFVRNPDIVVLTAADEAAFTAALAKFVKKNSSIRTSVGKKVSLRLPPQVTEFVDKLVVKGKVPTGIRFNRRTQSFSGAAKRPGVFTVTLTGDLKGTVNGSTTLKPIRIRFLVRD